MDEITQHGAVVGKFRAGMSLREIAEERMKIRSLLPTPADRSIDGVNRPPYESEGSGALKIQQPPLHSATSFPEAEPSAIQQSELGGTDIDDLIFEPAMLKIEVAIEKEVGLAQQLALETKREIEMEDERRQAIKPSNNLAHAEKANATIKGNHAENSGAKSVTTATCKPGRYPTLPIDLTTTTHDNLVSQSIEIAIQFRQDKDYGAIRDAFVKVSLELNQFGLLAPVFRDQPRIPFKKYEQKAYTQLLIDQIVIDCHWLHCRGEQLKPQWAELSAIFSSSANFDCDVLATQVAAKNWSCDFRVEQLIIVTARQQAQLMQLRTKKLKERFRILLEGGRAFNSDGKSSRTKAKVSPIRMAIANWADRNHRVRGHEQIYESIWFAMELLDPEATKLEIAELAALRCGVKPLEPRTVLGKIGVLTKILTKAGIMVGE